MKRPIWATVAGVLGMLSAGAGILSSGQMVTTAGRLRELRGPAESLRQAVGSFTKPGPRRDEDSALLDDYLRSFSTAIGSLAPPAWYTTWCMVGGIIGMGVAGALLAAASGLFQVKRWAIAFFYAAAGLDLAWAVTKLVVGSWVASPLSMTASGWALPAILVDASLLVVVAMGDKAAFRSPREPITSSAGPASTPLARP